MRLLHVVATPRSHESNTVRVSNALLEQLYLKHDDLSVDVLDLFKADLPAVAGENIESKYKLMTGQELDSRHRSSWDAIEASIKRFLEADVYLLSVPMWNFGVPYRRCPAVCPAPLGHGPASTSGRFPGRGEAEAPGCCCVRAVGVQMEAEACAGCQQRRQPA
jgi:hypothetical protein